MTIAVITQATASAPSLRGTNGDLNAVLNFALTHASLGGDAWAREFHDAGSNTSIFRAASGNRFRLYVRHDSSVSGAAQRAIVRGCESASAYNTRVDEFPTAAQVADASSNWLCSSTADTTARNYICIVTPVFVLLAVKFDAIQWEIGFFGDLGGGESGDAYDTICAVRSSTSNSSTVIGNLGIAATPTSSSSLFWARDISGTFKSSRGWLQSAGSSLGSVNNTPAMKGGYDNRIRREKIAVGCIGSANTSVGTMAMLRRGWIPNLWQPLHNGHGGVADGDTGTDTAYDAASLFRVIYVNSTGSLQLILEESDTWSPPSG